MMHYSRYFFLILCTVLAACSSEDDLPGSPPVASAGTDREAAICAGTLLLDGSGSSDADGDTLAYTWTISSAPAGSTASLNNDNEPVASITPDTEGTYEIRLTVSDGVHEAVSDVVVLTITEDNNNPPQADAGEDRTVAVSETVTLDAGNSSDPEGDPLSYQWALTGTPVGSQAVIANADQAQAQFTPDLTGNYIFDLKVTDTAAGCVREDRDNLLITAE